MRGENSATIQATGAGPIDAQVSNDGFSWTPAIISTLAGAVQSQPFTPTSGTIYQVTALNADCVQILPDATWSTQSITVTFKASSAIAAVPTPGGALTTPAPCATAASPAPAGVCAHSIAGVGGSVVPYASIGCNQEVPIAIAMPSATTTELMAGTTNEQIYLCGFQVQLGSNGVSFRLSYSATNCLAMIALTPAQSGSTAITALTTYASLIVPAGTRCVQQRRGLAAQRWAMHRGLSSKIMRLFAWAAFGFIGALCLGVVLLAARPTPIAATTWSGAKVAAYGGIIECGRMGCMPEWRRLCVDSIRNCRLVMHPAFHPERVIVCPGYGGEYDFCPVNRKLPGD